MAKSSAPCRTCGVAIPRTKPTGPIPWYCSEDCEPGCSFDSCGRRVNARGLCSQHNRQAARGEPLKPITPNWGNVHAGKTCAVESCGQPRRKGEWCARHYATWRAHGDPLAASYEWDKPRKSCRACGVESIGPGMRGYCSRACQRAAYRARTGPSYPESCVNCGVGIRPYRTQGKASGRSNVRYCADCRPLFKTRRSNRLAVHILAYYQGADCGICGRPIDMEVKFPDGRCATVDHIKPLAFGGTDEVENLQLAHYSCNCRKKSFSGP